MILALDSSQNSGSIALKQDDKLLYSSYFDIRVTHSETLLPTLDQALKLCEASPSDLEAVVLAIGPGSFTGLRIGLATAKGIAYGRKIPIFTFDSLRMIAYQGAGNSRQILSLIDAKMSELYAALYDSEMNEVLPPGLCKLSDLGSWSLLNPILLGSAAPQAAQALREAGIPFSLPLPGQYLTPAVSLLGLLELFPRTEGYDFETLAELEPLYLRESTAQVKKRALEMQL